MTQEIDGKREKVTRYCSWCDADRDVERKRITCPVCGKFMKRDSKIDVMIAKMEGSNEPEKDILAKEIIAQLKLMNFNISRIAEKQCSE